MSDTIPFQLMGMFVFNAIATASDETLHHSLHLTTKQRDRFCETGAIMSKANFENPETVAGFDERASIEQNKLVILFNESKTKLYTMGDNAETAAHEMRHAIFFLDSQEIMASGQHLNAPSVDDARPSRHHRRMRPEIEVFKFFNYNEECACFDFGARFNPHIDNPDYYRLDQILKPTPIEVKHSMFHDGYPTAHKRLEIYQAVAKEFSGKPHPIYGDDFIKSYADWQNALMEHLAAQRNAPAP